MLKKLFIISLLFSLLTISKSVNAQSISDAKVKAIYVLNFAKYVSWPDSNRITKYRIGVLGEADVYKELRKETFGKFLHDREIEVMFFKRRKYVQTCQVLFVANDYNYDLAGIVNEYKNQNTLIITDRYDKTDIIMINILPLNVGKKRYEVNKENIQDANLTIKKQLLLHGGTETELRTMYSKAEKELKAEEEKLKQQQELLRKQTELYEKQKEANRKQQLEITKQQEQIETQREELEILLAELEEKRKELDANIDILDAQKADILEQQQEMTKQEALLEEQKQRAAIQNKSLEKQTAEIEAQQERIKEQREILRQQGSQIETQQGILYIILSFLGLVLLLVFFIWRSYAIKKRINKELENKNIAINKQKEEIEAQSKQLEVINTELEKLSIVASKTENAVTIMDAEGNFVWVNAGFTRLYGFTLQLLTHERDKNIIKASSSDKIADIVQNCINTKQTQVYEALNYTRNGDEVWVQTTLTPILDDFGKIVKLVTIETDIRQLKEAERAILEQNKKISAQAHELEHKNQELEKLSIVASETDNAIIIMDGEGNFEWINAGYTRMFGFTFDQLVARAPNIIGPETPPDIQLEIHRCINTKKPVTYEFNSVKSSGDPIYLQTTLTPIVKNGQISKLVAIDTDITRIKEAEQEIRQQHEEILQQKETLELQNEEIQAQRDKVEIQNKHIKGSIRYALTIQNAFLPLKENMDRHFESFVIFKPKDIVSGDFYWYSHREEINTTFIAVVDCTGHGVPGAFMSMIGSRLLNEIVNEREITSPAKILEMMDDGTKLALKQDKTDNNDGMDVALISLKYTDEKTADIVFAGAKRPLFAFEYKQDNLKIIKGTRRSIGGMKFRREKPDFENNELTVSINDTIYLSSDGLIDQNNRNRKRFGSTRFVRILKRIGKDNLQEQKEVLLTELERHQNTEDQRDDISLIGIKI